MGLGRQIQDKMQPALRLVAIRHATILKPYTADTEAMFRARNLTLMIYAAIVMISGLLLLFAFETSGLLEPMAKMVFTPLFLAIVLTFSFCLKLVADKKLRLARAIVTGSAILAVVGAITVTGGFPQSVASVAVFIPIVIGYCLYGGKRSHLISVALIVVLLLQWFCLAAFNLDIPNFTSEADNNFNMAVATTATILVACTVLALFDESNRKYIQRANAAVDSKTNFLANTSHEIRTPMNGIIGMTEVMLRTTKLDQDQKIYLDAIHNSGSALMTIINDILDYSRLEGGHIKLSKAPFDLYDLAHEIETLMTINAAQNNVVLSCEYEEGLARKFSGDAGRIRQVMMNLIANAIKFTKDGAVKIIISGVTNGALTDVRIDIEDDGIGIAKDKIDSIFERFTQAESGTTQKYGGTGLGLSISQRLANLMDGTIHVESVLGEGSVFSVKLPLIHARQEIARPAARQEAGQNLGPVKGLEKESAHRARSSAQAKRSAVIQHRPVDTGKRILMVTQNRSFVEDYGYTLREIGVRVFHTGDLSHIASWVSDVDAANLHVPTLLVDMSLSAAARFEIHEIMLAAPLQWRIMGLVPSGIVPGEMGPIFDCVDRPERLIQSLGLQVQQHQHMGRHMHDLALN